MLPRLAAAGAALALAAGILLIGPAASADVDDFAFESMHVDYTLTRDDDGTSRLTVVETLVALFPEFDQNRGIVRDIPTRGADNRVDVGVDVRSVTDGNGVAVPYEESRTTDYQGTDYVSLALGTDDYVHGLTTYVIEWTAHDVVGSFADTGADEFYWDVNGVGWSQPFESVTADIHLGPGLDSALTGGTACYAGYEGDTTPCDLEPAADGFTMDAGALTPFQNASIAIGFEPGTFRPGTPADKTWPFVVLPWVLLGLLVAAVAAVILLRRFVWVHAPGRGIIVPEYEGPENIGVMPAAELVGRPATALPAQIVRLAVEDVVRLVEDPGQPENRRFRLDLLEVAATTTEDDELALEKLFGKKETKNGASLVLDRTDRKLGDRVASLTTQMRNAPRTRKLLDRGAPSPLQRLVFWPAFLVALGGLGLAIACGVEDVGSVLLSVTVPVAIAGGIVVMGFSGKPERRTAEGTAVYEKLLGLRDYLQLAEEDRLRVLQSPEGAVRERIDPGDSAAVVKLYERLLPWAIVWGVEDQWSRVLETRYSETVPPSSNLSFATGFAGIAAFGSSFQASSFSTTPIASSSSGSGGSSFSGGSSGGGSSGGGGGGGGGGGR